MTDRPNTILMYTPSTEGGMAQYAWEVMHALARHPGSSHKFELITGTDLQQQFRSTEYPIHDILPSIRHRSDFSHRAAWVVDRLTHYPRRERLFLRWLSQRPDVTAVHFQEWTPWLAVGMCRRIRAMGKRVFYTVHNVVPHHYPALLPRFVMNRWVRRASRSCDGLFVHTDRLAAKLSGALAGKHPPIHVMPHGTWTVRDNSAGKPPLAERLSWRKLLFFGMIRRNKGLDVLLRAMSELPGYSLTIAGEPHESVYFRDEILPLIASLRNAGAKIDLIDRFVPDDELGRLFESHSAVVLPYRKTFVAQSGVIFLSLAYELPVVASEAGGLRDLFTDYRVGRTYGDETPQALAGAVREMFAAGAQDDLAQEISKAKRHYSWSDAAAATVRGYDAVLAAPELGNTSGMNCNERVLATISAH